MHRPEKQAESMTGLSSTDAEEDLRRRFDDEAIGQLTEEFLEVGTPYNLRELAGDRQFVVAYIDADGRYSDIPRSAEATVFSETFDQTLEEVVEDYGKYDPTSVFATVIDISTPLPKVAGVLRITEYSEVFGFKDVNDLLVDDPDNPWIDEIKDNYFEDGEDYDVSEAWKRLGKKACGEELVLAESLDIASHASAKEYRGVRGDLNGVSMLFYHACLRYALAKDKKNLFAIFDIPPLENLQQFGKPFDVYYGLKKHKYGGPFDALPAFCVLKNGMQRIRDNNELVGKVFIDGVGLDQNGLLPNEYLPKIYSDQAVNL
ncbi:hypothetical protein A3F37_03715 [Candidatus Saccharibacteria bacterium RIFCSPHIGHO2_12_FULL_41_12]|nr:MAG: hypothetical protein A3F37_03715 [Candidatus Saccharibacteria bacterium RIFCSPHIGHO2_12_FULL_41_12]